MEIIDEKIKDIYDSKADFAKDLGISPKDYSSKFKTIKNRIDFINKFLRFLNLKVQIVEVDQKDSKAVGGKNGNVPDKAL